MTRGTKTKAEPTMQEGVPASSALSSASYNGVEGVIAGDGPSGVTEEEGRGEDVHKVDSGPGDDAIVHAQQKPSSDIDASRTPTIDDVHMAHLVSVLVNDKDEKNTDSTIPWPLQATDEMEAKSPTSHDSDTTMMETTISVKPSAALVETTTIATEAATTTAVLPVALADGLPKIITDLASIENAKSTNIATTNVLSDGDVVQPESVTQKVESSPKEPIVDEEEGESLMAVKQRLEKEAVEQQKATEQFSPDLDKLLGLGPSGENTPVTPIDAWKDTVEKDETNKGVKPVPFPPNRDLFMSDDDDLFLDCDSTASVSNYDGA
jgi:hypothetical protein